MTSGEWQFEMIVMPDVTQNGQELVNQICSLLDQSVLHSPIVLSPLGGELAWHENLRPHPRLLSQNMHLQFPYSHPTQQIPTEEGYGWAWGSALFLLPLSDADVAGPWTDYTLSSKQAEDTNFRSATCSWTKRGFSVALGKGVFSHVPFLMLYVVMYSAQAPFLQEEGWPALVLSEKGGDPETTHRTPAAVCLLICGGWAGRQSSQMYS